MERLKSWTRENHPNWNPNKTEEDREYEKKYRKSDDLEFKNWSRTIKELANFTCARCNKTNCKLESHHILSWIEHENKRYDLDNGICLCKECHKEFHKIYKYKNNGFEQLEEYVKSYNKEMF